MLESVFYEALDESAAAAKNRFNIKEADIDVILKGGLAKLVSKRTNTSFASDYRSMGQTPQDKVIKNYLDQREEAIALTRHLTSWQAKELRRTGKKPEMWEHKELWNEFIQVCQHRAGIASIIEKDYDAYKDRFIQLNMNYATLQKYASQAKKENQLDKVLIEQKTSILHEQTIFKELIQSVASGQSISIRKSLNEVNLYIAEIKLSIEENSTLIIGHTEERQNLLDAAMGEEHFRNILMPQYLSRIYHTYKGSCLDAGVEALETYHELVAKYGYEKATNMVVAKSTILGDIRGYGFSNLIAFTNERKDATELCKNLGKQLRAFNESANMERTYKEKLDQNNFGAKIFALEEEIEHLRSLLPADIDRELMDQVGAKLKITSNNIDWRELQNSELFEAVRVAQISKAKDDLLSEHDVKGEEKHNYAVTKKTTSVITTTNIKDGQITPNEVKGLKQEKQSWTYAEVKAGLNQSIVTEIFRQYAPHLNPDGKIQKRNNQISSGSLNMDLGSKLGLWKRFSDGSKGDIFSFVEEATRCSKWEALEIVASHAGVNTNCKALNYNHPNYSAKQQADKSENNRRNEWVAVSGVVPKEAVAFDVKTDLVFLSKNGLKVIDTYEYKNIDNQLLGYGVRLEDKEGKKQVLPVALSYNEALEQSKWMPKGFTDNGAKPIYGLEKLAQHPEKPILIVEGEKTTDATTKLFPNYTVISWMGGAQSVDRVDWSNLSNKIITIWPDNDAPGVLAAKNIAEYIDNHNGFTGLVSVVDTKSLNLPQKWDLADKLPDHLATEQLEQTVVKANIFYSQGLGVFNHEVMSQEQQSNRITLDSIDILVASGRLDKDEYISKEIYHDSMVAIASKLNIDLTKSDRFISNIRSIQDEYRKLHKEYALGNKTEGDKDFGAAEQVTNDLVRDTYVLHQLQLGVNKLTSTHREHIENTAKEEVYKRKSFSNSGKEYIGSQMYHAVTRNQWREKLDQMNEQKSAAVKSKIAQQKIETQHITSTIADIQKEKDKATTPEQVLEAFKKEQGFLIHLHGNVQYPDHYNQSLLLSIQIAMKNKQDNTIDQLDKLSSFVQSKNFKTAEEITKILKNSTDPMATHKTLLKEYHDYFIQKVHYGLEILKKGETLKLDNHTVSCPVKFIEHMIKTYTHEFMPHQELRQIQNKVIEHQKQLELSKDMGGFSL